MAALNSAREAIVEEKGKTNPDLNKLNTANDILIKHSDKTSDIMNEIMGREK